MASTQWYIDSAVGDNKTILPLTQEQTPSQSSATPSQPADDGVVELFDFDGVLHLDRSAVITPEVKALLDERRKIHPIALVSKREKEGIYTDALYQILDAAGIRDWFSAIVIMKMSKRVHIGMVMDKFPGRTYVLYDDSEETIQDCSPWQPVFSLTARRVYSART